MRTSKILLITLVAAVFGGIISAVAITKLNQTQETFQINDGQSQNGTQTINRYASFTNKGEPLDFSEAAEKTVPAVVHVKVTFQSRYDSRPTDLFEYFFGTPRRAPEKDYRPQGSGSGVIISPDGYIVTNNHVIDNASEIRVTLDDKTTLQATLVGADQNTDVAVLKVEKVDGKDFPYLSFANSDQVRLGQWVLAVGNPYNLASLTSTVTAGIISAKSRRLGMSGDKMSIEAFLQTDAVVNPGNSGGALVNLAGELVGINTAIASKSGQYEGYSFAIPSNIAKKVAEDIIQFGVVQRAMMGISYIDLNSEDINQDAIEKEIPDYNELKKLKGVYIAEVIPNSAASIAGVEKGDVLVKIGERDITGASIVSEEISKLRPGDKIDVTVARKGKMKQMNVTLRNTAGNTNIVTQKDDVLAFLGAEFKQPTPEQLKKLNIPGGVQISKLTAGKLRDQGVREGYIIVRINQRYVSSENDIKAVLQQIRDGGVFVEGIYPDGKKAYYAFGI